MESRIDIVRHSDGDIQRLQVVSGFAWRDIRFSYAPFSRESINRFAQLYRLSIISRDPCSFGRLLFFHVPHGFDVGGMPSTIGGVTYHDLSANLAAWLASGDPEGETLFEKLEKLGYAATTEGAGSGVSYYPLSPHLGFAGDMRNHQIACNSHFFLMEPSDLESRYDLLGSPFGMVVEAGRMHLPPLYHRPAIAVDKDGVHIVHPELKDVAFSIDGVTYRHGENCTFYERPDTEETPAAKGTALLIADGRVVASKNGGRVKVPMGGFVIHVPEFVSIFNPVVACRSRNSYQFAIQAGPVMVDDGVPSAGFGGFPLYEGKGVSYPPTVFPLDWDDDRSGRMVLGGDRQGNPVLVWAESAGALGYEKGSQSSGCTLSEMASYCRDIGLATAVNLDGGGSAVMYYSGMRLLRGKDRTEENRESPRPVPAILVVD